MRWAVPVALVAIVPVAIAVAHGHRTPARSAGPSCFGKPATIVGTPKADKLIGTPGNDVIVGGGGNDTIIGRGGNDLICGGSGRDLLLGGPGNDSLNGGSGIDSCDGGAGVNRLSGCELTKPEGAASNKPPHAGDVSASTNENSPVTVDVVKADSDPDGEPLKVVSVDSTGTVGKVAAEGSGGVLYDPAGMFETLAAGQTATTSFGYTVADGRGGAATARVTMTIRGVDTPPVAVNDAASLAENDPATKIDVLANDTDVDGGPKEIVSTTDGSHGTVAITGGGSALTYEPASDYCGADAFTYTLNGGSVGHVSVTIACVDQPPVAVNDTASLAENDSATEIDVLANDTDVDGGPKEIVSTTDGSHGIVAITGGGSALTYEPEAGYCNESEAQDTFSYTLNGGSVGHVSVSVSCVTTVAANPGLTPPFDPAVSDYTVKCTGSPLQISGRTAEGATVSVDGQASEAGAFQTSVPLEENQEFEFSVTETGEQHTYYVRCLPSDFPTWEYTGYHPLEHEFYVVNPSLGAGAKPYIVVFDKHGVPVWWYRDPPKPIDAKFLSNGSIAWWGLLPDDASGYGIRNLKGELTGTLTITDGNTNEHDLQPEPNGDYLLVSYQPRENVDLTPYGGGPDDTVLDGVVEEITPSGEQVWKWSTAEHISLAETGRWWPIALQSNPRDPVHLNAVEPVGDERVLISLRQTDAVYMIDKASGEILWKLGGTWTPKSLTVLNDPQGAYPLRGPARRPNAARRDDHDPRQRHEPALSSPRRPLRNQRTGAYGDTSRTGDRSPRPHQRLLRVRPTVRRRLVVDRLGWGFRHRVQRRRRTGLPAQIWPHGVFLPRCRGSRIPDGTRTARGHGLHASSLIIRRTHFQSASSFLASRAVNAVLILVQLALVGRLYGSSDASTFFVLWTVISAATVGVRFGYDLLLPKRAAAATHSGSADALAGYRHVATRSVPFVALLSAPVLIIVLPQTSAAEALLAVPIVLVGAVGLGCPYMAGALARGYGHAGLSGWVSGPIAIALATGAVPVAHAFSDSWLVLGLASSIALAISAAGSVAGWPGRSDGRGQRSP